MGRRFTAECEEHGDEVIGPVGYLEHRREFHEGWDFTLVWVKVEDGGRTTGERMRYLLRRAWRRAGGQ